MTLGFEPKSGPLKRWPQTPFSTVMLVICGALAGLLASPSFAQQGGSYSNIETGSIDRSETAEAIGRYSQTGFAAALQRTAEAAPAPAQGAVMIPPAESAPKPVPAQSVPAAPQVQPTAPSSHAPETPKTQKAEDSKGQDSKSEKEKPKASRQVKGGLAQQYCVNISDAAADARFAWQAKTISDFEKELDQRIKVLEEKTEEYKKWLDKRNDFVNRAHQRLVDIFTRMRPDAVALQLANLDEATASAVVMRLEPRIASAILNEMDPMKAARLSSLIAQAANTSPAKPRNALAGDDTP